jgi:hypothetical protein
LLGVHGIDHQHQGQHTLHQAWYPALLNGLTRSGAATTQVSWPCTVLWDMFRSPGQPMVVGDLWYTADDIEAGLEADLLLAWCAEAARVDRGVGPPDGG